MKIINANKEMLAGALEFVNTKFKGNIEFRTCHKNGPCGPLEPINKKETSFEIRLTVKDSHAPGSRVSPRSGRRIKSACWHVVGHFCAYLLERGAKIRAAGGIKYDKPEDNWKDRNIGSIAYPAYFSEACDC